MAVAAAARAQRARPRSRPRSRSQKAVAQRRIAGGAVWIAIMAVLLAGVVALNVALLRLNMQSDQLGRELGVVGPKLRLLASMLAARSASARTSSRARRELGLQPADPLTTKFLDLSKR